jgi:hypothetical protein
MQFERAHWQDRLWQLVRALKQKHSKRRSVPKVAGATGDWSECRGSAEGHRQEAMQWNESKFGESTSLTARSRFTHEAWLRAYVVKLTCSSSQGALDIPLGRRVGSCCPATTLRNMSSSKFAGLPDIDASGEEVYETADVPSSAYNEVPLVALALRN